MARINFPLYKRRSRARHSLSLSCSSLVLLLSSSCPRPRKPCLFRHAVIPPASEHFGVIKPNLRQSARTVRSGVCRYGASGGGACGGDVHVLAARPTACCLYVRICVNLSCSVSVFSRPLQTLQTPTSNLVVLDRWRQN